MRKYYKSCFFLIVIVFYVSCKKQVQQDLYKKPIKSGYTKTTISQGPSSITRNIIQDSKKNIWIASFEGIMRYDGSTFINVTRKVSDSRFFAVLEDQKRNFWFASIGAGVFYYNGKDFKNFTTKEGLVNNQVTGIFEDENTNIWFATEGGASRYNGKNFRNYTTVEGLPHNSVSAIIEDGSGRVWFATRAGISILDRNKFVDFKNQDGKPFKNVRSILADHKGNIWIGGSDGLWRYNGKLYKRFSENFVGNVYEDSKGNIWTSSEIGDSQGWQISRYDEKTLDNESVQAIKIMSGGNMYFGILEDSEENIWFGTLNGVNRYNGCILKILMAFNGFNF